MSDIAELRARREDVERRIEESENQLRRIQMLLPLIPFINHDPGCDVYRRFFWTAKQRPCDCGLDAALKDFGRGGGGT